MRVSQIAISDKNIDDKFGKQREKYQSRSANAKEQEERFFENSAVIAVLIFQLD